MVRLEGGHLGSIPPLRHCAFTEDEVVRLWLGCQGLQHAGPTSMRSQPRDRPLRSMQACTKCRHDKRKCDLDLKAAGEARSRCQKLGLTCVPHVGAKRGRKLL